MRERLVSAHVSEEEQTTEGSLRPRRLAEYIGQEKISFCEKDIILGQFKDSIEYIKFSESSLDDILTRKKVEKNFRNLLLE